MTQWNLYKGDEMTYQDAYKWGVAALAQAGVEEAMLDARLLLEDVCHTNRNDLLVHGDRIVEEEQLAKYREYIGKRGQRIPLQHITGVQEFMGLTFAVNEHVLIPRQDTEVLVEEVLRNAHEGMRILDMCTGSGCILISLLHYTNNTMGVGVDISENALDVAKGNTKRLLADRVEMEDVFAEEGKANRVEFVHSDLFANVQGKFDIIVSNPPYIRTDVIETLMPEVRMHEPMQALDGYADGLYFYRKIVEESKEYLVSSGMLYFEIGHDQAQEVSALMECAGYGDINVVKDLAGLDRVVYGTYIG